MFNLFNNQDKNNSSDIYIQIEREFLEEAIQFVEQTNIDLLAISIGTQHGLYTEEPDLDFERLQNLNENIDIPMVLHGGSGTPALDVKKAIKLGISKVNVGTDIYTTYMNSMKEELNNRPDNPYTLDVMSEVQKDILVKIGDWLSTLNLLD